MRTTFKPKEFGQNDLSKDAFFVYINSDFTFTESIVDGTFNVYIGQESQNNRMGSNFTLQDIEDFLLQFKEEE